MDPRETDQPETFMERMRRLDAERTKPAWRERADEGQLYGIGADGEPAAKDYSGQVTE